jgi:hypothetical protein
MDLAQWAAANALGKPDSGLAALEKWDTIEYAAGYRARLAATPDSEIAHHCWRCGWQDADTEALERSIVVHHRVPGKSILHLMISLCPGVMRKWSHKGRSFTDATASARIVARTTPAWT